MNSRWTKSQHFELGLSRLDRMKNRLHHSEEEKKKLEIELQREKDKVSFLKKENDRLWKALQDTLRTNEKDGVKWEDIRKATGDIFALCDELVDN